MQRLVAMTLLLVISISCPHLRGIGFAPNQFIEFEITHTHDHDSSHEHTHEASLPSESQTDHSDFTRGHPHHSDKSHSHTIVVAISSAMVVPQEISFSLVAADNSAIRHSSNQKLPLDRSLGSIFRPPISA